MGSFRDYESNPEKSVKVEANGYSAVRVVEILEEISSFKVISINKIE
jgi:hypothetical protein